MSLFTLKGDLANIENKIVIYFKKYVLQFLMKYFKLFIVVNVSWI